jgi:hypothetical protein
MIIEHHIPRPPSKRKLAWLTALAFVGAGIALLLVVLPAEFHLDPTGFGRLIGLDRLAASQGTALTAATAAGPTTRYYKFPIRSDSFDIPLAGGGTGEGGNELEYKLRMKAGDSFVYSWSVTGVTAPDEFYFDFHSEAPPAAGEAPKVIEYLQTTGTESNGVFIAPVDGVHGWYLQNQGLKPAVVHLKLSGFYQLIPPGEYGNKAGIKANSD